MQAGYQSLIKFILPPYILAHFELKSVQEQQDNGTLEIELEEANLIPDEFGEGKFYSKGFYPKITIQDFPLRGQRVFLHNKDFLSDYMKWNQKSHAKDWLLFADNIGPYLSIDETSLANGELYRILTNKAAKGKDFLWLI